MSIFDQHVNGNSQAIADLKARLAELEATPPPAPTGVQRGIVTAATVASAVSAGIPDAQDQSHEAGTVNQVVQQLGALAGLFVKSNPAVAALSTAIQLEPVFVDLGIKLFHLGLGLFGHHVATQAKAQGKA